MIVPSSIPIQNTTPGQVYSADLKAFSMRLDNGGQVDIATGTFSAAVSPDVPVIVFPAAKLVLG